MMENLERGQIWYVKYNDAVGYEEAVGRPAVVVSTPTEENPLITMVWLTTTPKSGGTVVEMSVPKKRSWAMCHHIVTIDKSRLLKQMCCVTEAELLKIDVALRTVLSLPVKDDDRIEKIQSLEDEISHLKDKIAELEIDNIVNKRLYDKAIEKIIELKFEKDIVKETPVAVSPVLVEEEPLDITGLKNHFGIRDKQRKALENKGVKRINANTATKEDFESIGIGEVTANDIVRWRKNHGPFASVEDMTKVARFGNGCLRRFGDFLEV